MTDSITDIREMRNVQLDRGLYALAIVGLFALVASLARSIHVGWNDVMAIHIGIYMVVLIVVVLRRHLSFKIRALIVCTLPLVIGIPGLLYWGLLSFGVRAFLVFCIIMVLLFGTRAGIVATLACMVVIGLIGLAVHSGLVRFYFDPEMYQTSILSWVNALMGLALCSGVLVMAIGTMQGQMIGLIQSLKTKNEDLLESNRNLCNEIEERKRLEREKIALEARVQRAKKMEAIGTMAAGVAHDLNNVLTGIVGYPDLLLRQLPEDSPFRTQIQKMQKSGRKAAAIVDDLLTLARRSVKTEEIVSLNDVVSDYLKSPEYETLMSYHSDVSLKTNLEPSISNISGSSLHLSKTLMNLLSNAAEAMPLGGTVTLSTQNVTVSEPITGFDKIEKGTYTRMTVADTGIGIPSQDIEKIFEPFYTKKVMGRSGTGLGMAVVWGTVKDHNGHIDISSVEGEGTRLSLYFPVVAGKAKTRRPKIQVTDCSGSGETVLVIDDMEEQRTLIDLFLTEHGYRVLSVPSGEDAVEYLKRNTVDLLILDMVMPPGIDGLETYKQILEFHPGQKAIIASGFTESDRVREAQKLGAGEYIKKPYSFDKMCAAVRTELSRN